MPRSSVLCATIITRRKVRLRYLYRGSGKRGYLVVQPDDVGNLRTIE